MISHTPTRPYPTQRPLTQPIPTHPYPTISYLPLLDPTMGISVIPMVISVVNSVISVISVFPATRTCNRKKNLGPRSNAFSIFRIKTGKGKYIYYLGNTNMQQYGVRKALIGLFYERLTVFVCSAFSSRCRRTFTQT